MTTPRSANPDVTIPPPDGWLEWAEFVLENWIDTGTYFHQEDEYPEAMYGTAEEKCLYACFLDAVAKG
jgi:hypothetical protein